MILHGVIFIITVIVFCSLSEYPFRFYVSGLPSFNVLVSSNKHHSTLDLRCFLYWVYASVVLGRQKLRISETRDYWIIYRGPGFLAVLWFGSSPTPSNPPLPSVCWTGDTQGLRNRDNLLTEEGEGKGMRSQIIWLQESLVLYKSLNTLCLKPTGQVGKVHIAQSVLIVM